MPKRHTYFGECTQELRFIPEPDFKYLGKFTDDDLLWIRLHLVEFRVSYECLKKIVDDNILNFRV
jgi:hypothetical protein